MIVRYRDLPIVTAEQMRAAERAAFDAGTTQDVLMERAGTAVADAAQRIAGRRPILVLAGPGNNGGDAYVAARVLAERGRDVAVATLGAPGDGAAARMASRWSGPVTDFLAAEARSFLIDGLFGIGLTRALDPPVWQQLCRLQAQAEFSLAIDVPSGLATDTGEDFGQAWPFDATLALGALKPVHVVGPAIGWNGEILFDDLGLDWESGWASDWRTLSRPSLSAPASGDQKFSRGMVTVLAGAMPGAAALAAGAAMHGGAGYVVLAGKQVAGAQPHALVRRTVRPRELASLLADRRIASVLVGPGLGRDKAARATLEAALASPHALVIDGDALSLLGTDATKRLAERAHPTCLTPHSGEFDRMFGAGQGNKIERTLAAAQALGATIVHKGADTVIARPDGQVRVTPAGSSWLSTAGSGDVLAGLVAGRLAVTRDDPAAAMAAVWLHGRAAELAGPAFIADDLVAQIPRALRECL